MNCVNCKIGIRKIITKQIKERVKEFDGREYQIVQDICAHYKCDEAKIFHSQPTDSHVERTLYIYCMVYILGRRQVDIAHLLHMQKANVSRDFKSIMTKFKDKKEREKFKFLTKY